ncbi:hypothetical protein Sru01_14450 [Sphaerisporangium rufum]|uniref:Uncharacterized protein n=1 Tax=Sphaerisporangium rufum TaxID=1381558 RepID=A0A919QZZ9_9ACTN|nr:hypothetical protein Sru01_14450 [Sphaerisporangium rufum]
MVGFGSNAATPADAGVTHSTEPASNAANAAMILLIMIAPFPIADVANTSPPSRSVQAGMADRRSSAILGVRSVPLGPEAGARGQSAPGRALLGWTRLGSPGIFG